MAAVRLRGWLPGDLPLLQSLWLTCFHEKENAAVLFFNRNLSDTHGYVAEENGALIAAVYLIDCTLCGKPAHYLCGAATLPDCRGRGVMHALLAFALDDAKKRGDAYSVLLPADDGLYAFYGAQGYVPCGAVCYGDFTTGGAAYGEAQPPTWRCLQQSSGGEHALVWGADFWKFARGYYACYGAQSLQTAHAAAIYEQDGTRAEVFYAAYDSFEELKAALAAAGIAQFGMAGSAANPDLAGCTPQRCGMVRTLQTGLTVPKEVYIGITLD